MKRSSTVGIPNSLTPPSGFGISTRRTGRRLIGSGIERSPDFQPVLASDTAGVLPPSSRQCPVLRRSARPASSARNRLSRWNTRSHTPAPSVALGTSSVCAGDGSALWPNPGSFTAFAQPAVPLSGAFCLHRSSHEPLKFLPSSTFGPSRHLTVPVLWPLLTPAASAQPLGWGCRPQTAWQQVSPGKNADFPCTLAPFTLSALDCIGLRCYLPARPADPASYGVRVPQSADLPPASFAPHLAVTHLPLANGWCNQPPRRDSHSQASAHAGRTKAAGSARSPHFKSERAC